VAGAEEHVGEAGGGEALEEPEREGAAGDGEEDLGGALGARQHPRAEAAGEDDGLIEVAGHGGGA
jgi:hypothetical protein